MLEDLLVKEEEDARGLMSVPFGSLASSFSCPSPSDAGAPPRSRLDPGVLGVLVEEPKDAKAPDPSPKAEEAPLVGDATLVVVRGATLVNGLVLLLKDSNLFAG